MLVPRKIVVISRVLQRFTADQCSDCKTADFSTFPLPSLGAAAGALPGGERMEEEEFCMGLRPTYMNENWRERRYDRTGAERRRPSLLWIS
jgi:hypothetical protein